MKNTIALKKTVLPLLVIALLFALAGCGKQSDLSPAATETPEAVVATETPAGEADQIIEAAWPADEAIAYCPVFEGGQISKVTKQEGAQKKTYIIAFDNVEQAAYDAYAAAIEADEGLTVVTNFNTRGTAYQLNAHKSGDEVMAIRVTYTKPTKKLQISVVYEP